MSLDETLGSLMGAESVKTLSEKSGASEKEVSNVLSQALPALLKGAQDKSAETNGNAALNGIFSMMEGKDLSDLTGMLKGNGGVDALGMMESLLGGGKKNMVNKISQSTGVKASAVESIAASVLPMLMGSLGKDAKSGNGGLDIASLISSAAGGKFDLGTAASALLSDADGDGKPDGIKGLLGKLFGGRR